jgi:hypothetical protein
MVLEMRSSNQTFMPGNCAKCAKVTLKKESKREKKRKGEKQVRDIPRL